jgi:DNA-binding HxlR family transcriptional regulator
MNVVYCEEVKTKIHTPKFCRFRTNAVKDSMSLLSGKWKIHILGTLLYGGPLRFMDVQREVDGIGPKMLSKELQELELNQLVKRTVLQTKPITVQYELTSFGRTLEPIIESIAQWGIAYREDQFGKKYED